MQQTLAWSHYSATQRSAGKRFLGNSLLLLLFCVRFKRTTEKEANHAFFQSKGFA